MKREKTRTEVDFERSIKEYSEKINRCELTVGDALELEAYLNKIHIHFDQIRKARDNWRTKYEDLKNGQMCVPVKD